MKLAAALLVVVAAPALAQDLSVRVVTLKSPALGEERTVYVLTPPGYERGERKYPVLYFTDGERHLPLLATTARFLADVGRMPEVILVGLSHPDRTRDLTPTRGKIVQDRGPAVPYETSGGADRFLAFVAQELVPWVDRSYRAERFRILAGHSFGGLFALHAAAARPGVFQAVIAASPTLTWDGNLAVRRVRDAVATLGGTIVFSMGEEGRLSDDRFEELKRVLASGGGALRSRGLRLAGEDHLTTPYPTYYAGLREVFDGWSMPVNPEAIGPRGGVAAVEAHYRALSQRLGFAVPPPERALALAGLQELLEADTAGALRTLGRAVELYPSSARALHALGAAHEHAGDHGRAVDAYRRAWAAAKAMNDRDTRSYEASYTRAAAARAGERRELPRPGDPSILRESCDHFGRYEPDSRAGRD
ncbi:alpha/beta hydrolase [Anaeromyxobacter sp. Fw109-5]|uniref:alpha/beta hydrolase n=1 Tax=Anaeromyxobacter sp. (strain Fw109-5) TaxID=404589 RepID=UPI0002FC1D37|nr:alpha/beta hydrolase-fold protein [Anaeromyxobacter sp. Fw109-5]